MVDLQQFKEDGYLVLKEVVPSEMLDQLRTSYETLVDRKREIVPRFHVSEISR